MKADKQGWKADRCWQQGKVTAEVAAEQGIRHYQG